MAENKLADLSMDFAIKILKTTDGIKGYYSLINQLERSATSIGANIREAKYAHSKADFISKLQIALKECYETDYWPGLFKDTNMILEIEYRNMFAKCSKIRKLLIAAITTAKKNIQG